MRARGIKVHFDNRVQAASVTEVVLADGSAIATSTTPIPLDDYLAKIQIIIDLPLFLFGSFMAGWEYQTVLSF